MQTDLNTTDSTSAYEATTAAGTRASALLRNWRAALWVLLLSAAILIPCFWHSRIQAGDLSSHVYNTWLVSQIRAGHIRDLQIAAVRTNVLFDWILEALANRFGLQWGERLAVSLAVLNFFWASFAFVGFVAKQRPLHLTPVLAMLTYGVVFHFGFFNFYLSAGLCLWAVVAIGRAGRVWKAAACGLCGLALLAHPLPVVWASAYIVYTKAAVHLSLRVRHVVILPLCLALVVGVSAFVRMNYVHLWDWRQVMNIVGADQTVVFGKKYVAVFCGLLAVWSFSGLQVLKRRPADQGSAHIDFAVITGVALAAIPSGILIPGYAAGLEFLSERMSIFNALLICGILGSLAPRAVDRIAPVIVAALFFSFLNADTGVLNTIEDNMQAAVQKLPRGSRVISTVQQPETRLTPILHTIDRACAGWCFSYANYEPSTGQFRVRAPRPNPFVMSSYHDCITAQLGTYVVKQTDLPLFRLNAARRDGPQISVRATRAGEVLSATRMDVMPEWW